MIARNGPFSRKIYATKLGKALDLVSGVYNHADSVVSGKLRTTVNELTDQIPATRPEVLVAAASILYQIGSGHIGLANKTLSEEDKGAAMAGLASAMLWLPMAMARPYAYEIPGAVACDVEMEYGSGRLYLNGVQPGDKLLILDDTLATGGTAVAIGKAAQDCGAEIVEMRVVVEKIGYGGSERIFDELGIPVYAGIGISVDTDTGVVRVERMLGQQL